MVVIEPMIMCPCGKSIIPMNGEQTRQYEEAVEKIKEAAKDKIDTTPEY